MIIQSFFAIPLAFINILIGILPGWSLPQSVSDSAAQFGYVIREFDFMLPINSMYTIALLLFGFWSAILIFKLVTAFLGVFPIVGKFKL